MSPWHDVALRNDDGTLNFVCEIPKDTWAKNEVATVHLSTLADIFAGTWESHATKPEHYAVSFKI